MKVMQGPYKTLRLSLIFALVASLTVSCITVEGLALTSTSRSYNYDFVVDEDGFTRAMVNYESYETGGSSWVFVPKSWNGTPNVVSGTIVQSSLVDTKEVMDESQYFYQAYKFTYQSSSISHIFNMTIEFSMDTGALIVEPRGIFFSPLIGFQEDSNGKAEVFLPNNSEVTEAVALGSSGSYKPSRKTLNYVLFDDLRENLIRLQIEFNTSVAKPELLTLKQGIFTFESMKRYQSYASDILGFFNDVYDNFVGLFNVTLESVDIRFFLPEFDTLLSVGGYVPFTGGKLGDIHINIFFVRAVKGVLEVIALHELVHHFLWKAGLSPVDLLWFHEGMAQYVSIETSDKLGYEGAVYEREKLEQGASQLTKYGENFYFLQDWETETQPADVSTYYIASYYVVSRLAEKYDDLDYYRRFFTLIKGTEVKDNNVLAYYLSLAANTSVVPTLRKWGFDIVELQRSPIATLTEEAERAVYGVNPAFQPYKFLAESLYKQGLASLEKGEIDRANQYLEAAIFMAELAPILTLATIGAVLVAVLYAFKRRRALPKPENLPS